MRLCHSDCVKISNVGDLSDDRIRVAMMKKKYKITDVKRPEKKKDSVFVFFSDDQGTNIFCSYVYFKASLTLQLSISVFGEKHLKSVRIVIAPKYLLCYISVLINLLLCMLGRLR